MQDTVAHPIFSTPQAMRDAASRAKIPSEKRLRNTQVWVAQLIRSAASDGETAVVADLDKRPGPSRKFHVSHITALDICAQELTEIGYTCERLRQDAWKVSW